jgi:hypothetical protein
LIEQHWKRIAGMHVNKNGDIAMIWMGIDTDSQHIHIYDACKFEREVAAVIAESINARGRWIPIAWTDKEQKDSFLDRGCRMLPDPSNDSDAMAEIVSRDLWERMRAKRISIDKRLKNWLEEATGLQRTDGKIPKDSSPLMSATRIAMQQMKSSKRQQSRRIIKKEGRRVAVV